MAAAARRERKEWFRSVRVEDKGRQLHRGLAASLAARTFRLRMPKWRCHAGRPAGRAATSARSLRTPAPGNRTLLLRPIFPHRVSPAVCCCCRFCFCWCSGALVLWCCFPLLDNETSSCFFHILRSYAAERAECRALGDLGWTFCWDTRGHSAKILLCSRSDRINRYWTIQQQGLFARVVVAIRCW